VLGAIEAAHRAGVRHRDVKPANVLLGDDGRVVLTDFGIATIEGDGIITSSDLVLGSPQYMSPERVRDGTTLPASDLWSLGATLYTAVEGRPPYKRASVVETLTAVAADEPTPAERAGVLEPVLDGLLRKDPAARIDVEETRRLLEEALTGEPAVRPRWPWSPRRPHRSSAIPAAPAAAAPAAAAPAAAPPAAAPPEDPAAPSATAPREPTENPAAPAAAGPPAAPVARATASVVPRQRMPQSETIPGPAPEARPEQTTTSPRRLRSLLVAGVAAAVLAAGGTTWYARHDDGGEPSRGAPTAGPTRSAPDSPTPGASAIGTTPASPAAVPPGSAPAGTPAASAPTGTAGTAVARPALPAGWRDYTDPTGFRVYVPKGWSRSKKGSIVYFRDGRGHVLGIDQTNKPQPDPVADWRGKAAYRVGAGDFPGYHEIKIVSVRYWLKAADWEFTFNGSTRQHVNNRGFITSKKQAYGIYWQTTDARWKADRDDLQLVFDSFRPKHG
jgi:hypothetical protein